MNLRRISLNFVEIYIISIEFTYFMDKLEIITDEKTFKLKKIYKNLLFVAIFAYVLYIFIGQQKTLNSYKNTNEYYTEQINKQLAYQESLTAKRDNINSKEYIEDVAREKLDMYLPNERVYIDKTK